MSGVGKQLDESIYVNIKESALNHGDFHLYQMHLSIQTTSF